MKNIPDTKWNILFSEAWEEITGSKSEIPTIIYDEIQIRFKYGEDIQSKVDEVKEVVMEANKLVLKYNQNEILRVEQIKKDKEEQINKLDDIKKQLKRVRF